MKLLWLAVEFFPQISKEIGNKFTDFKTTHDKVSLVLQMTGDVNE